MAPPIPALFPSNKLCVMTMTLLLDKIAPPAVSVTWFAVVPLEIGRCSLPILDMKMVLFRLIVVLATINEVPLIPV